MHVVVQLLAERIGEPGEAAHRHAHGEVLALDVGRADVALFGLSLDPVLADADALARAVAARAGRLAVELHELGIVHVAAERPFHSLQIRAVAVCRELDPVVQAGAEIVHQGDGGLSRAVAAEPRHDELGVGV